MSQETDFLVIGGGLAGISAALAAAEAGLSVILLEKLEKLGGSSAMCGGCLAFAGTDLQAAHGIEDSADLLFSDLREVGKSEADETIIQRYADEQLATYDWLIQHGVSFNPVVEAASGQSVPRVHSLDPADLVRLLARRAEATGKVTILTEAAAQRLNFDHMQGRVVGATVDLNGESVEIRSRAGVLLAAGGFVQDREMLHRFAPKFDDAIVIGGAGNTGDGLRMGMSLGADLRDMVYIKGTFGKHPIDTTNDHSCLAVYKGAIAVNQDGQRYVDESISYKLLGDACMEQTYGCTYQILDSTIMKSGDNRVRILDFERRLEEGLFVEAETLEELAAQIEIDPAALTATVARYNNFVDQGEDEEFGRKHLVHNHGALQRIETGPFYAYPSTAVVFGTYCGLRIDPDARVIDVYGAPIDGLLAAGEVTGGFHGAAYMTGSALGKAVVFGRIAALTAAATHQGAQVPA